MFQNVIQHTVQGIQKSWESLKIMPQSMSLHFHIKRMASISNVYKNLMMMNFVNTQGFEDARLL